MTKFIPGRRSFMASLLGIALFSLISSNAFAQKIELDENIPDGMYEFLEEFLTKTYLSGYIAKKDLYRVYYANRLKKYWNQRNVPLRRVIADKKRHFARWPYTSYRLIDNTLSVYRIVGERNAYALRFDYNFNAERPGRQTSGIGRTEMLLRVIDGRPVIYREAGRVLKRYR